MSDIFFFLPCAERRGIVEATAEALGRLPSGTNRTADVAVSLSFFLCHSYHLVNTIDCCRVVTSRMAMAPAARASMARSLMYVVDQCPLFLGDDALVCRVRGT